MKTASARKSTALPRLSQSENAGLCSFFAAHGIQPYDEESGKGLVRHIFLRRGTHSGQIMVCLVCTRAKLPHAEELCRALTSQFSDIATILINVNARNTNVILGSETHPLRRSGAAGPLVVLSGQHPGR